MELASTVTTHVRGGLVLVPVGSLEQHGPHLPLDTDTVIATAVATGVANRLGAWVAPALAYGSSGEHQSFPGTVSIGTEALTHVVVEMVRSLRVWAERVVLINAHGGNVQPLVSAVSQLRVEGHDVAWVACVTKHADLHAGRTETSLMLHLSPWDVRVDRIEAGDLRPVGEILPIMREGGVAAVSANGVLGDPTGASAHEGMTLFAALVDDVLAATGAWA